MARQEARDRQGVHAKPDEKVDSRQESHGEEGRRIQSREAPIRGRRITADIVLKQTMSQSGKDSRTDLGQYGKHAD